MTTIIPIILDIFAAVCVCVCAGLLHLFIGLQRSGSEKHITIAIEAAHLI